MKYCYSSCKGWIPPTLFIKCIMSWRVESNFFDDFIDLFTDLVDIDKQIRFYLLSTLLFGRFTICRLFFIARYTICHSFFIGGYTISKKDVASLPKIIDFYNFIVHTKRCLLLLQFFSFAHKELPLRFCMFSRVIRYGPQAIILLCATFKNVKW